MSKAEDQAYRRKHFSIKLADHRYPTFKVHKDVTLAWNPGQSLTIDLDPVEARQLIEALEAFAAPAKSLPEAK